MNTNLPPKKEHRHLATTSRLLQVVPPRLRTDAFRVSEVSGFAQPTVFMKSISFARTAWAFLAFWRTRLQRNLWISTKKGGFWQPKNREKIHMTGVYLPINLPKCFIFTYTWMLDCCEKNVGKYTSPTIPMRLESNNLHEFWRKTKLILQFPVLSELHLEELLFRKSLLTRVQLFFQWDTVQYSQWETWKMLLLKKNRLW